MPGVVTRCTAFATDFATVAAGAPLPRVAAPRRRPPPAPEGAAAHVPYWGPGTRDRQNSSPDTLLSPSPLGSPVAAGRGATAAAGAPADGALHSGGVSTRPSSQTCGGQRPALAAEYNDVYRGATWNAQGLLAFDLHRQHAKRVYLHRLLGHHDSVAVQETHATEASAAGVQLPDGVVAMWSHGSRRQGGIALLVQAAFLRQFSGVARDDWEEILPGRLAALHLGGGRGALSIAVVWFASGPAGKEQRADMRPRLQEAMARRPTRRWIITGDFNWVPTATDRVELADCRHTGGRDADEEADWRRRILGAHGLEEVAQSEHTFQSTLCRSRLDRAYGNHHTADYFDGVFWAVAWPWPRLGGLGSLSDHRPLSFGFRRPAGEGRPPTLRAQHVRRPDLARRVAREYQERMCARVTAGRAAGAMEGLRLLKGAMYTVSGHMEAEASREPGARPEPMPPTAATAFALLSHARRGVFASAASLWGHLPEA